MAEDGRFVVASEGLDGVTNLGNVNYGVYLQRHRPVESSELGFVGDRVWNDLDGDGTQDPTEPGYQGVVELYNASGTLADLTTADASVGYRFDVPAGEGALTCGSSCQASSFPLRRMRAATMRTTATPTVLWVSPRRSRWRAPVM